MTAGSGRQRGQGKGESKTSPRMLTAAEREVEAFALRKQGKSYQAIADAIGAKSPQTALNAINRALAKLPPLPELAAHRKMEWETLNEMQASLWPKVEEGDTEACRVVIRIIERRAKMVGSDALPSLNSVSNDVVQGVLDALIGLAVRLLTDEQRPVFLAEVERSLLQIEAPKET